MVIANDTNPPHDCITKGSLAQFNLHNIALVLLWNIKVQFCNVSNFSNLRSEYIQFFRKRVTPLHIPASQRKGEVEDNETSLVYIS